jgi:serine/threonine protein kinase
MITSQHSLEIQVWPLDRLVFYVRNPRKNDAAVDRRARFEKEARAIAALAHPNIVVVHDVGYADGVYGVLYMVSELVRGESLRELMGRGPLPVRTVIDVAVQLADGMAAAHAEGITHRGLKPANIMITGKRQIKVLDFGLAELTHSATAQFASSDATVTIQSDEGLIVGTTAYMSPEQAQGQHNPEREDVAAGIDRLSYRPLEVLHR